MKLQPLGPRILVETEDTEISSLIVQAEDHRRPPTEGRVVAVGPKSYDLKAGDRIFFDTATIPSWWDGAKLRLIEAADILAIL